MIEALNGSVRPVIAFAMTGAVIYLAISGTIAADDFTNLAFMVLGFFFGARETVKAVTDAVNQVASSSNRRSPDTRTRVEDKQPSITASDIDTVNINKV